MARWPSFLWKSGAPVVPSPQRIGPAGTPGSGNALGGHQVYDGRLCWTDVGSFRSVRKSVPMTSGPGTLRSQPMVAGLPGDRSIRGGGYHYEPALDGN